MQMPNRNGSSGGYRYGFQGQEVDNEIKGEGNSVNYKYRMHDPRIGRFFAVDPLTAQYPHNSPYTFSENSTIAFVELEGLEKTWYQKAANNVLNSHFEDRKTIQGMSVSNPDRAKLLKENAETINTFIKTIQLETNNSFYVKVRTAEISITGSLSNANMVVETDVHGGTWLNGNDIYVKNDAGGGAGFGLKAGVKGSFLSGNITVFSNPADVGKEMDKVTGGAFSSWHISTVIGGYESGNISGTKENKESVFGEISVVYQWVLLLVLVCHFLLGMVLLHIATM